MTDQELMMKAAKAAGAHSVLEGREGVMVQWSPNLRGFSRWNPLADDGDALRLAVKLEILVLTARGFAVANSTDSGEGGTVVRIALEGDHCAATRRAIVRAAAALAA